jgi:hypothetical protein
MKSQESYCCELCDYVTCNKKDYNKHLLTAKHQKNGILSININKKNPQLFLCEVCDHTTYNIKDYNRHLITAKHNINIQGDKSPENPKTYLCNICSKEFKSYNSLWNHKNRLKCNKNANAYESQQKNILTNQQNPFLNELFVEFLKQNKEIQNTLIEQNKEHNKQLLEISKNQSITNNTTNNNNTTNQQFNLQFFLNETCKDAMNITEFVNSLQLKMEDFEETGKIGFVEGISRIIINGLKQVDTTKRPIHCTDAKRETIYIKHDNSWEKEDQNKGKLKQAVNQVARMNLCQLPKWQQLNPESAIIDTRQNDEYVQYSIAALGGRTPEEDNKYMDKIMRNVMKEVVVDKTQNNFG